MLKKVLNLHEAGTDSRLRSVCERYGALVYAKIRLADVFPIEDSGIDDEDYSFSLKSHFDFLATDNEHNPLFSVEYDGHAHKSIVQKKRDQRKNYLCRRFNLPILRINANYLIRKYRGLDLLTWLVDEWFFLKQWQSWQEEGMLPLDEPFIAFDTFTSFSGREEPYPRWLSAEPRLKIQELCKAGACQDDRPSWIISVEDKQVYRVLGFLRIDNETGIVGRTAMLSQQFPILESDILGELIIYEVYSALERVLNNKVEPIPLDKIKNEIKYFQKHYTFRRASISSRPGDLIFPSFPIFSN